MGVRLLLDTHALVWSVSSPQRLGSAAHQAILDRRNQVLVSSASAWEIATKVRLGRLPEARIMVDQFDGIVDELGAEHLSISSAHALRSGGLDWGHRDPFDRMLAAQALLEHATLVSRDSAFAELGALPLLW